MRTMNSSSTILLVLVFPLAAFSCATPYGGALFSQSSEEFRGYKDQTDKYAGKYIRGTSEKEHLGRLGGQATHTHSYAHTHEGDTGPADRTFRPIGNTKEAARSGHTHSYRTTFQEPTLMAAAANEPPYAALRFNVARCPWSVPAGTIIAFTGAAVPQGWKPCDGTNQTPDLTEVFIRIGSVDAFGTHGGSDSHAHGIAHQHDLAVTVSSAAQTYRRFNRNTDVTDISDSDPHGHTETGETQTGMQSTEDGNTIPAVLATFIMATKKHSELPVGALIPATYRWVPYPWRLGEAQLQRGTAPEDLAGYFLRGRKALGDVETAPANDQHNHQAPHAHTFELSRGDMNYQTRPNPPPKPPIAKDTHSHPLETTSEPLESSEAYHLPEYVEFFYIVKTNPED